MPYSLSPFRIPPEFGLHDCTPPRPAVTDCESSAAAPEAPTQLALANSQVAVHATPKPVTHTGRQPVVVPITFAAFLKDFLSETTISTVVAWWQRSLERKCVWASLGDLHTTALALSCLTVRAASMCVTVDAPSHARVV